jgi:DNA adenine methylase
MNGFRRGFKNGKLDPNTSISSYLECVPLFVERLRDVIIENLDWRKVIRTYDSKDTLFYVDPPYLDEVCTSRSVTYAHPISREEHVELANILNACQGNVVISGYESELYASLYAGWFTAVKKAISGMGKHRVEKIWIKRQENSLFS